MKVLREFPLMENITYRHWKNQGSVLLASELYKGFSSVFNFTVQKYRLSELP